MQPERSTKETANEWVSSQRILRTDARRGEGFNGLVRARERGSNRVVPSGTIRP